MGMPSGSTCGDYTNLSFFVEECKANNIINEILEPVYHDTKDEATCCTTAFGRDLKILTHTADTLVDAKAYLDTMCAAALAIAAETGAPPADWAINRNASGVDLVEFFNGEGFLNMETGNFQQDADDFAVDEY
jgi:hypothetical protein